MSQTTPIERVSKWFATREDRGRTCAASDCTATITLRESTAAGHRTFCSPDCHDDTASDLI